MSAREAPTLPPRPTARWLWLLPLALALLFAAAVLAWQLHEQSREAEARRTTLMADALSLESRLQDRVEAERRRLEGVAGRLAGRTPTAATLAATHGVAQGLRSGWAGLIWLDDQNRVLAEIPAPVSPSAPPGDGNPDRSDERRGLSVHLSTAVPGGGMLIARYQPAELLRRDVPWWVSYRYDVRFVDSFGQTLAAVEADPSDVAGPSHAIQFDPPWPGVMLQLAERRSAALGVGSALPLLLMGGFLLLLGGASALLRRQMTQVLAAEDAWRKEAAWRHAMEDSLTVGLRARSLDGTLLYVNRALCDMVGWPAEELVGRPPPMPYWPSDQIDETMERLQRIVSGQAPREGYEARWIRRDGRELHVMIFEAPLIDAGGRRIGWMGSVLDMTERRAAAERERQRVDTMTHHARLTTLGEIASTLAHELNQPLAAIASYSAGLQNTMRNRGLADATLDQAMTRLGEQAQQAARIVQRIREFLTRREPRLDACRLADVADQAALLLARDLERRGVSLSIEADARLPLVRADAVLIEQVLINLIRNAADALLRPGEPDARSAAEAAARPQVRVRLSPSRLGFVRVDVEDNGPGLRGKRLETLSQPFYSTKPEGMGMGLAICRSIVEIHYGALAAEDRAEGGARFSFTLPQWVAEHEPTEST